MTNKEKALKLINEYLAKQEPQKIELALIDDIEKILDKANWNMKEAASATGVNYSTLMNRIKKFPELYATYQKRNGRKKSSGSA